MRTAACLGVAAVLLCACASDACTSFAVYSDRVVYGMNFDYDPGVDARVLIDDNDGTRSFHLGFIQPGVDRMAWVSGVNERGLLVSAQMLFPEATAAGWPDEGEVCPWTLYTRAIREYSSVEEVLEFLEEHRMVDCPGITLHLLVADTTGAAVIVEAGPEDDVVIPIEGDYIAMTNFPNADFVGAEPTEVQGFGATRYTTALRHIENNFEGFDTDDALEALRLTSQGGTRLSMAVAPGTGEIYVTLEGDFDRVLSVSVDEKSIETHSGFDRHRRWRLGPRGVSTRELAGGEEPGFLERVRRFLGR